jgi:hypothetical protein
MCDMDIDIPTGKAPDAFDHDALLQNEDSENSCFLKALLLRI